MKVKELTAAAPGWTAWWFDLTTEEFVVGHVAAWAVIPDPDDRGSCVVGICPDPCGGNWMDDAEHGPPIDSFYFVGYCPPGMEPDDGRRADVLAVAAEIAQRKS